VRQVAPGSAAAAAGLQPGDRIVALNGRGVQRAGEVIRGVRLLPDGQPLVLSVERGGQRLELRLRLPPSSDPRLAARDNGANA
jgi:regulator of sigma E protease